MKKNCLVVLALFLAGCTAQSAAASPSVSTTTGTIGLANPWGEGNTLQEAVNGSGVSLTIADPFPVKYDKVIYRYMKDTIEVRYTNATQEINLRKSSSQEMKSISGDYNVYANETTVSINGTDVQISGNGNTFNKAEWNNTDGVYSITVNPGTENGVEQAVMESLIKAIK